MLSACVANAIPKLLEALSLQRNHIGVLQLHTRMHCKPRNRLSQYLRVAQGIARCGCSLAHHVTKPVQATPHGPAAPVPIVGI